MTQPAPMTEEPPGGGGGGGNNPFTRHMGPFPLWVWMGLGLAIVLAYANWSKAKKGAANANQGTLPTAQTASGSTPASLIPQFVNQVYENPSPPVINVGPFNNTQTVTPPPVEDTDNDHPHPPGPPTGPPPGPPHPQPAGQWVTVAPWSSTNAPWNSTLWGIAQHTYGNGALYPKIFAANKQGIVRPDGTSGFISNPNLIHPGDRIFVPA